MPGSKQEDETALGDARSADASRLLNGGQLRAAQILKQFRGSLEVVYGGAQEIPPAGPLKRGTAGFRRSYQTQEMRKGQAIPAPLDSGQGYLSAPTLSIRI